MNASPSSPYGDGGISSIGKTLFLLFFVFFVIIVIGTSGAASADLNPYAGSSSAPASAAPASSAAAQPQVVSINDNTGTSGIPVAGAPAGTTSYTVPVTGSCTDPYTVQPGEFLSQIAEVCNTTVASIRLANPQITNINLIYPGMQLRIPGAQASGQTVPVPVTGPNNQVAQAAPTATAQPVAAPNNPAPAFSLPVLHSGSRVDVTALYYPPNTPVNIAVGPQTAGYNVITSGVTDANGTMKTQISLPTTFTAGTPYVVVVATTGNPPVQAMSKPFFIGQ